MGDLPDLPNEIWISILHRVKDQDFLRKTVMTVCKRWNEIISTKNFWIGYHRYHKNRLPLNLFNCDFPWQYYADIR